MDELFDKDEKTIRKHINNIFEDEELDYDNNTQKMRVVGIKQKVPFYTLMEINELQLPCLSIF